MNGRRPYRSQARPIGVWSATCAMINAANCRPNQVAPCSRRALTWGWMVANIAIAVAMNSDAGSETRIVTRT